MKKSLGVEGKGMMQRFKNASRLQKVLTVCGVLFAVVCLIQIFVMNTFQEPGDDVFDYSLIQYDHNLQIKGTEIEFSPTAPKVETIAPVMAQKPSDDSGALVLEILHGDKVIFRGSRHCYMYGVGEFVDFPVRLTLDPNETYTARLEITGTELQNELLLCGIPSESGETEPLLVIQCAANLKLIDKCLMALYVCLLLCLFLAAVYFFPRTLGNMADVMKKADTNVRVVPAAVTAGLMALAILEYSEAELTMVSKLLISLAVFASSQWLLSDPNKIKQLTASGHQWLYAVLSLWAAFSIVGSKLFLEEMYQPVRPTAVLTFFLTAFILFPVIWASEMILRGDSNRQAAGTPANQSDFNPAGLRSSRKQTYSVILFIIFLTLVTFAFYMRAFNPAISSPDTQHCMYFAKYPMNGIADWHPAFYILWLKAIVKICPAAEAVVFVQFVFFAYVMIRAALFLQKKRIPRSLLYIIISLAYLNVANMSHLMIIWKDIPYTLSILWLTVTLARIFFDRSDSKELESNTTGENADKDIFLYAELIVSLVWTCLFRHPGIVVFLIVCAALVLSAKKNIQIYVSVAIAVLLVVLIKGPVYDHYDIQKDHGGGIYIGLGADIMGVYYNNGELADETASMIETLAHHDMVGYTYMPSWSNASYDLDVSKGAFIKAYIDTFLKNPLLMTKCIIARMGYIWDVFEQGNGELGTVNYTKSLDSEFDWNAFWNTREVNFFTWKIQERLDKSVENPLLNTLEWRCRIYFLLVLVALGAIILKERFKTGVIVFLPCLAHVLSLMLSTGWSEFRYVWPVQLMAAFLTLFTLTVKCKSVSQEKSEDSISTEAAE